MVESTPLALLPLIAAILVMSARFYIRESAISIFKLSFMCAALSSLLLVVYMFLMVLGHLPDYAWVGFGGVGAVITLVGIVTFAR